MDAKTEGDKGVRDELGEESFRERYLEYFTYLPNEYPLVKGGATGKPFLLLRIPIVCMSFA